MKILYKSMYSALLMGAMGLNATAQQQLPNWGFEEEWVNCGPWTSTNNSSVVSQDINGTTVNGQQPKDWCISDVIGMKFLGKDMGATIVGFKDNGYNSNSSVQLKNSPNPLSSSQIVPAYITLGKTWSTAKATITGNASESDGGSFSGIKFTSRPTGLEFMYKRSRGTDKPNEKSTVVAYIWKGRWSQANVPGCISMSSPKTTTMIDRDRCVLGMNMEGFQGGEVSHTDGAELIASIDESITENASDWTKFSAKFNYKSEANPDSINVIIAAGDYFGGSSVVGKDNELIIDNIRLFYNFEGFLNIDCAALGGELAKNQAATITIIPDGNGKCTFKLPDFKLGEGEDAMQLGDIVVEDVTMTDNNGIISYTGVTKDMKLMDNAINADVTISGKTQGDKADMKIDVLWTNSPIDPNNGTPINVSFATTTLPDDPTTGITDINVDNSNAPVEFYNLQGIRVNADNLVPGIYVRRQGSAVSKVLVK